MGRAVARQGEEDGDAVLRPSQPIDRAHVAALWAQANRLLESSPARIVLDLRQVTRIDGAGVALLRELEERCRAAGIELLTTGASDTVSTFVDFVRGRSSSRPRDRSSPRMPRTTLLRRQISRWGRTLGEFVEFVGAFAKSAAYLATHPHKLRLGEMLYQVQKAGADGMLVVGGLSLMLGVIMAFQGITGLHGFGSPIFVADVVTLSTTREMAPLLTGVIVTGRSGAAVAAEIATMRIDEEIDALSVMGFDVMRFLLVPRILGLALATPLLTLLSMACGILGGASVAVFVLHLSPAAYFAEVRHAITAPQVATALVKGLTFGVLVGGIACFQGLQAGKAAEEVGKQTTSAVVKGILLVVFADAFFSIAGEIYGW